MADLTDLERRWLDYARRVVNVKADHIRACEGAGGVPDSLDVSRALRWPGYIGRRYEEGVGVLCVAQVHRDDNAASERVDPQVNIAYVAAVRNWKLGQVDDAAFLEATRAAYEHWIPGWIRWRQHFGYLVQEVLGLSIDQIAYANLAKCQLPITSNTYKVVALCQREFPMCDLACNPPASGPVLQTRRR